jgi:hypothetical protein
MLKLCCIILCLASIATAAEPRGWTSADGKIITATFLSLDAKGVTLKMSNGTVATVPLSRLSKVDQDYAQGAAKLETQLSNDKAVVAEKTWPKTVVLDEKPEVVVIQEDAAKKEFIYRSPHYEFICDSRLGQNVVREFGRMFEATYQLNCKLPLDWKPKPEPLREYFRARLFTDAADYAEAGGTAGSGGIYMRGEKALMVPLSSLGVKMVGSRVSVEANDDDDNATLIHEITHQMMNHWLARLPTWFVEGSAEYCEMLEYNRSGRFSLNNLSNIVEAYTTKQNYGIKGTFKMLDIAELMNLSHQTWSAALTKRVNVSVGGYNINNADQADQNYPSAGLLTFYFYHLDGDGDAARMIAYLRALEKMERPSEEEKRAAVKEHLLYGRSYEKLAEEVKKGLKRVGVDVVFDPPGKNGPVSAAKASE